MLTPLLSHLLLVERRPRASGWALLVPVLCVSSAGAAAVEVNGQVSMGSLAERNPRLSERDDGWVSAGRLAVNVELAGESERSQRALTINLAKARYPSHADLDQDQYGARFSDAWATEHTQSKLQLRADDDDARTAALANSGAFVDDNQRRHHLGGQWSLSADLAENLGTQVNIALDDTAFTKGRGVPQQHDFSTQSAGVGLNWQLGEGSSLGALVFGSRFVGQLAFGKRFETTSGLRFDFTRDLSEATQLELGVGVRQTQSTLAAFGRHFDLGATRGLIGDIALVHHLERGDVRLALRREIAPSGIGSQLQQDQIAVNGSWEVNEAVGLSYDISYVRSAADAPQSTVGRRSLINAALHGSWQYSERLILGTDFNYRTQQIDDVATATAQGVTVALNITYRWQPYAP